MLSELLEEARVVVEPGTDAMARAPLIRAGKKYRAEFGALDEEQRARIEEWLDQGRILDAAVEQMGRMVEQRIAEVIEGALEREREGRKKGS